MDTVLCFGRQGVLLGNDCRGQLMVLYLLAFLTKMRMNTYRSPVMIYKASCGDDPPEAFFKKMPGAKNVRIFPAGKDTLFIAGSGKDLICMISLLQGQVSEAGDDAFFDFALQWQR